MATPRLETVWTKLVTTTLENRETEIMDNVTEHNALLTYVNKRGNAKKKKGGGLSIVQNLSFTENGTYQRFSGYDILDVTPQETLTVAEYPWRAAAMHVSVSGDELAKNSGKEQLIDLVEAQIENAKQSFANNMSTDLYSNGALANQIGGIQLIIADDPTNTVGGIDASQSSNSVWRNVVNEASDPLVGSSFTVDATTIVRFMNQTFNRATRGTDQPDLIVMDENYFSFYEQSQQELQRYASGDTANQGFVTLKYKGKDVVFDTASSGIPSNHGYMINTKYLYLVTHSDYDMRVQDKNVSFNQDAVTHPIIWRGNLTCSNRKLQAVFKD